MNDGRVRRICDFMSRYAVWLFGSGCTCIRLEKNIRRMAVAAGVDVEVTILPRHIHLTVSEPQGGDAVTTIASIQTLPISYDTVTRLSRLSWDVADGIVSCDDAHAELDRVIATPCPERSWLPVIVGAANAAFCRLFGGDIIAMAVVFVATVAGGVIRQMLAGKHVDNRIVVFACSFVSAVLAAGDGLFGFGSTPAVAIGSSVLYLVPGIPFLNSFSDLVDGHYICALGRLMQAVVLTCCLSAGLCCGMLLMNVGMF